MKKIIILVLFCLLLLPTSAFAHKLIPTDGSNVDYQSALEIPNPVISWAMYEKLEDSALFYKFEAKKDDRLFSSIVIPKLDGLETFAPYFSNKFGFKNLNFCCLKITRRLKIIRRDDVSMNDDVTTGLNVLLDEVF